APGSFIKRHAQDREVRFQLVEVRLIGRAQKRTHTDEGRGSLSCCVFCSREGCQENQQPPQRGCGKSSHGTFSPDLLRAPFRFSFSRCSKASQYAASSFSSSSIFNSPASVLEIVSRSARRNSSWYVV